MTAPVSAPIATPVAAPAWVLGPLPTQPLKEIADASAARERIVFCMVKLGRLRSMPATVIAAVVAATIAAPEHEAQAQGHRRIIIRRRIRARITIVIGIRRVSVDHLRRGLINHGWR